MSTLKLAVAGLAYATLCALCFLWFTAAELIFFDPSRDWSAQEHALLVASQWASLLGPVLGGGALYLIFGRRA